MTKAAREELLRELLVDQVQGCDPREVIAHLEQRGLLDTQACERLAVRHEVLRRVQHGTSRCRAMEAVGETFCCSYEKIRGIMYSKQ